MSTIYLVSLLVGGFFILLSIFGGDADTDMDGDFDVDTDFDMDADFDGEVEIDVDGGEIGSDIGAGPGLVDLLTIRTLFLFATFFGLTGMLLTWSGTAEPLTSIIASTLGLTIGFGGNYIIKKVAYQHVSSDITTNEMKGMTGKVLIPFTGTERGKISLVVKGNEVRLLARSLDDTSEEQFAPGDEVVVVRTEKGIIEVVKPN
ncbi:MAG: hypothetical protein KTR29_22815 [Rhodothermaceae bacterium]|nr:hypothetical protein [Rhodothermaceae bacterium]